MATLLFLCLIVPGVAAASTVTVQGTTDIRDAGLLEDVIIPGFQAVYPQYTLKYIAVGSGEAIANAKAGQADALVTHAPTEEKSFVEEGYSLEPRGRAIFSSDYLILGPPNDPAGVLSGAPHNAALAYERIAEAGGEGKANFVSRGDDSGTNTAEKAIWKLTEVELNENGEPGPAGTSEYAPWYRKAGLGQAETVLLTQQCPFSGGGCYELTDRGTFNRLLANGSVAALKIVADKNEAGAPGGHNLLVNPFSAYVVNPAKIPAVNVEGARAFVDYLTSPEFQAGLASYPNARSPAFFSDAHPSIALYSPVLPARIDAGTILSLAGSVKNLLPGAPIVAGQPVQLQRAAPTGPKEVPTYRTIASTATGPDGRFGFGVPAAQGGRIRIQFPTTTAYPSLASPSPIAVGSLHETQLDVGHIEVQSRIALRKATVKGRWVRLQGGVAPSSGRSAEASLVIEARKLGAKQFRRIRVAHPSRGASYSVRVKLGQGRWQLRVEYRDLGTVLPASSGQRSVSVTAGS